MTKKLIAIVLAVTMLVAGSAIALAQEEIDTCEPSNLNPEIYFDFGGVLPAYHYVYYSTPDPVDLTLGLRDCCIRDDVVEVRINGCYVWTIDSRNGDPGTHVQQLETFSLPAGTYTIELKNTISSVGPSGWYYELLEADYTGLYPIPCQIEVDIDIKPMSDPNSINVMKKKGVTPVAILTTLSFDATTVDWTTVRFGPDAAAPAHDLSDPLALADHQHDVDLDGDVDFVFHFQTQDTGITAGDTSACLTGLTLGGMPISGCDSVRTVPAH